MKKNIAIVLLFVFAMQSTTNLWILASFYIQRDYIAENLCVNRFDKIPICKGQCYLNKQLKENEKQEQKLPDLRQKEIQLFFQQECFTLKFFTPLQENTKPIGYNQVFTITNFHCSIDHPPEFV